MDKINHGMRDAYGIIGYVSSSERQKLRAGKGQGSVDVRMEQGSDLVLVRIQHTDIEEVRSGAPDKGGDTPAQLIRAPGRPVGNSHRDTEQHARTGTP